MFIEVIYLHRTVFLNPG